MYWEKKRQLYLLVSWFSVIRKPVIFGLKGSRKMYFSLKRFFKLSIYNKKLVAVWIDKMNIRVQSLQMNCDITGMNIFSQFDSIKGKNCSSFLVKPEAYSRPSQKLWCLAKIVGSLRWLSILSKSSVLVVLQCSESTSANNAGRNTTIKES